MSIPTLTHDGLVNCPPEFFDDWIIDHSCSRGMDRFYDTSHTSIEWRMRTNAAALAADVAGARYDWRRASGIFSDAPLRKGICPKRTAEMFEEAWQWGKQHPSKWMDLPRTWIWNQVDETFFDVSTGDCLLREDFDRRHDYLCPLPGWPTAEFLISEDLIVPVEAVTRDRTLAKQFYLRDELLAFNYA